MLTKIQTEVSWLRFYQWRFHASAGERGTGPQIVARSLPKLAGPQILDRPPNFAVLFTHCGGLILKKISKFDATRCQVLRLKRTNFHFRWGSIPDSAGELTALSQTP